MDVGRHIATPACSIADNCVDNENAEEAENIAESEHVADKEGSESANIAAECMLYSDAISLKRRKSDSEDSVHDGAVNNAKRLKQEHIETLDKCALNNAKRLKQENNETLDKSITGNDAENKNTEETEHDAESENFAYKESSENAKTTVETMSGSENIKELEYGTETAYVGQKDSSEKSITLEEDDEIIEKIDTGKETANVALKEDSENASTKEGQVRRRFDMGTSTKEDMMPRKRKQTLYVPSRASFSYDSLVSNIWQDLSIKTSTTAQARGIFQESIIYVYIAESYLSEKSILNKFHFCLRGKELFYHGTTVDFAKRIIENGIDVTESDRPVDFSRGRGFYVTNDYDKALEWSKRKAGRYCNANGAVIAFTIDRIRNERHLSLDVNNDTNRKFWQCIVSHFRRGETSPDVTRVLRDVKYIEGPVAKNRRLRYEQLPTPRDSGRFHQLCICDQGYANRFGELDNILCVIIVKH